ncbi:hypothetical protein FS749_009224 [Ceratobasidium sp. UAMH 11750]|nr:hypothetical protein FS749_009224 [Ceratobasidium sp. UAMH 11750]
MSAQFAIDPALASGNPTTTAPSNLTKSQQNVPPSPPKQPGYYSILPALPPLPGWGPFPGPMFAPPGAVLPMPVYMGPPAHPNPNSPPPPGTWPEMTPAPGPVTAPAQPKPATSHYPTPASPKPAPKPPLARPRRVDPPPINPAAASSPHYQNPGGFGGVYTPPTHHPSNPSSSNPNPNDPNSNQDGTPPTSHYTNTKSHSPLTTLTSSGRQFACGQAGCGAAFDRKSDCERHRRTHVKGATEARPFRCGRVGCEAAFDRKDALMRHERNERTHLVRQTQPGRAKRPSRSVSKSDLDSGETPQPRRQSTRKRKSLLPSTVDMYASDEDDEDEDEDDHPPSIKRTKPTLGGPSRTPLDIPPPPPPTTATTTNLANAPNSTQDTGTRMEDMVVLPSPDGEELVIDPRLHGLGADEDYDGSEALGVETMQAVEAIQAALQQIEADADAEKRVG